MPSYLFRFTALGSHQMEMSTVSIYEALKTVLDYQTHYRIREAKGRRFSENLNARVNLWSIGQSVVILLAGVGQILVLRSFFSDKKDVVRT